MRKVVPPKLKWKYIGDESPEKRKESEERVKGVYDRIFIAVADNIKKKKMSDFDKIKKMKIAILSDSHDRWDNLEKAVKTANDMGCKLLLFVGDLVAPPGIAVLEKFNGDIKFIWGNNEGERMGMTRKLDASKKIELCGDIFEGVVDGIRIFMNHYPRFVELAAKSGEFDLCICGHTHEYREENVGNTLLLNPGEIQGYVTKQSGFAVYDTKTKKVERILVK